VDSVYRQEEGPSNVNGPKQKRNIRSVAFKILKNIAHYFFEKLNNFLFFLAEFLILITIYIVVLLTAINYCITVKQ